MLCQLYTALLLLDLDEILHKLVLDPLDFVQVLYLTFNVGTASENDDGKLNVFLETFEFE